MRKELGCDAVNSGCSLSRLVDPSNQGGDDCRVSDLPRLHRRREDVKYHSDCRHYKTPVEAYDAYGGRASHLPTDRQV